MGETKHTPGPWRFEGPEIRAKGGAHVAHVKLGVDLPVQHAANGHLLAAAPDLLAACAALIAWHEGATDDDHCWSQVRHAVAKAEGRP